MAKKQDPKETAVGCAFIIALAICAWFWFGGNGTEDSSVNIEEMFSQNPTVAVIRTLTEEQQKDLLTKYIDGHANSFAHINPKWSWPLGCMQHMVKFKAENIPLNTFGEWCVLNASDPIKHFYWDKTIFTNRFSVWDGSYRALVDAVKAMLHDPKSFEHVKTQYRIETPTKENEDVKTFIAMEYRAKNAFNAVVTESIYAQVDPFTGEILNFFEQ